MALNKRGMLLPVTGKHPFNFSRNEDYDEIIDFLKNLGYEKIILVGFSLGANVIQCYLGSKTRAKSLDPSIKLAVAVSSPYCFKSCCEKLDSNVFIQKALLNRFKGFIKDNMKYPKFVEFLASRDMNFDELMKMKCVKDIDDMYNAKAERCKDRFEFYDKCSGKNYIQDIEIDCLFINSKNDPLIRYLNFFKNFFQL